MSMSVRRTKGLTTVRVRIGKLGITLEFPY
jgi:hypothetical protein